MANTLILQNIYKKAVDRPIEGVIKADDDASLKNELEEYVLTNEVERRLEVFLDAYNNYQTSNGVWISGFFGSGKSHLLKILALLLENRTVDGAKALGIFLPKCENSQRLRTNLKRAISLPSKSILFNIDQKADVINKKQSDALLAVFAKVFDEMCGYYGKLGYIAQFERDLDSRNLYQDFKKHYQAEANFSWETGREQVLFESQNIANAYAKTTRESADIALGILDKYRSQYTLSIGDFAEQVKTYIDKQEINFRLNFFVDEVGQYIADNTKLMTNLQTVAESLATKCHGQAWIMVTAQEDMSNIVGEMTKQQGNDFTKIQARFSNRLKLTSQDVAEVIQKRLLSKKDAVANLLEIIYDAECNNFKTLFDFADGSISYQNFKDKEHFVQSYPFIPYQFSLFQSAIQNLSVHNAFEGKHSSVGERSMLGVFQQVAIKINHKELGQLATFDLMFEGIRSTLKSQIQKAVIQAENHLGNPFALRLLKALFLVKYVKEFKATIRNLCVLMTESFEQDLPQLNQQVEEALNLLEQQTYIQRNGEQYEYLTDEEKDVEEEIKNTDVESSDVISEIEKIIFDQIIKNRKIHIKANKQDYSYSRKLDDRLSGREYELAINIITPFHDKAGMKTVFQGLSMAHDEVIILMPEDDRLISNLLMYKRTQKYIGHNMRTTQQESVKRILADKGIQNSERYAETKEQIKQLLCAASILVQGTELELSAVDPQSRITNAFEELVSRAYPNLIMLRGANYTEQDISNYLSEAQKSLFGNDATHLSEAEQEVFATIHSNKRDGARTTIKTVIERFERKPYGWTLPAILCTLAMLCARGKVEVRSDGNILEDTELERALLNTRQHGNTVLELQIEFTARQVRALKEFYADFFDAPSSSTEAKDLGKETASAFKKLLDDLNSLAQQITQFPFIASLKSAQETVQQVTGQPYTWYLSELSKQEDDLLDLKEDTIDSIRKFMSGSQKTIYQEASAYLQTQRPNFSYIKDNTAEDMQTRLNDPACFKGNKIQTIKTLYETLKGQTEQQISTEQDQIIKKLTTMQSRLQNLSDFKQLNTDQQSQVVQAFEQFKKKIQSEQLIAVIRDSFQQFDDNQYPRLLDKVSLLARPKLEPSTKPITKGKNNDTQETPRPTPHIAEPKTHYISSKQVTINFDKPWLETEDELDEYLQKMRTALLAEIQKGKRVRI